MEIKSSMFEAWLILDLQMVHVCRSEAMFPALGWRLDGKTRIRGCSVGEQRIEVSSGRGEEQVRAQQSFGYIDKYGLICPLHSWASVFTWASDWMRLPLEETGPSLCRFYFLWVILRRTAILCWLLQGRRRNFIIQGKSRQLTKTPTMCIRI